LTSSRAVPFAAPELSQQAELMNRELGGFRQRGAMVMLLVPRSAFIFG
jgi:hypothetical protein